MIAGETYPRDGEEQAIRLPHGLGEVLPVSVRPRSCIAVPERAISNRRSLYGATDGQDSIPLCWARTKERQTALCSAKRAPIPVCVRQTILQLRHRRPERGGQTRKNGGIWRR